MATLRWIGNAPATYDVWTISLSGTVTSQTYTITINSKTITYAAGGSDTVAVILAALVAAWTSTTNTPAPEFGELTPVVSGSTIVATGKVKGRPHVIDATTGGGATFSETNTVAATGPNDFANGQNWSGGSAPANSDTIVFDNGNKDCLYGLNTSLTGITLIVQPGYTGKIGLPLINNNNNVTYNEYRTTSLTLAGGTATIDGPNLQRCNLAFGANTTTIRILDTSQTRLDDHTPAVLLTGGNGSSELSITKGDVGLALYRGTTATMPSIKTAFKANAVNDVSLICGTGCTLTTVIQNGGSVILQANVTTYTINTAGGVLTVMDCVITTITALSGTIILKTTGTMPTINLYNNAVLDCDQDPRAKTVTNAINVFDEPVRIKDNQKTVNSGTLSLATSKLVRVNVEHGGNSTVVYT